MADARVLKILLGEVPVGHLTGFQDGKSLFAFDDSYIDLGPGRPTLGLSLIRRAMRKRLSASCGKFIRGG